MPYNPGVEDRSGQLRAQGKLAQVGGIAEGAANGFLAYQQNKLRNQALQGENDGLMKVFSQDPELAKYAPEGVDKFLQKAQSGGGLTLDDNIRLNGMLNTAIKTKGAIQQQAMQEQQIKMSQMQQQAVAAQMQQMAAQMQQEKNDESALAAALRQFNPQQPTPELNMSGLRPAPAGAPMLDASGLEAPPDASPAARAQFDPSAFLHEYFKNNGSTKGLDRVDTALKMLMPQKATPAVKLGTIRSVDEKGNPVDITVDTNTMTELGRGPVTQPPRPYRTAQEEQDAAFAKTSGEEEAKTITNTLSGVARQAESARMNLATIGRINEFYDQGATTGVGQDYLTKLSALGAELGITDKNKLASQQALEAEIDRLYFEVSKPLIEGQGAVSDSERAALKQAMANSSRIRPSNNLIFKAISGVADRALKMDEERLKLEDQGVSQKDIHRRMERMRMELPIPGMDAIARMNAVSGTPQAAAATAGTGAASSGWSADKENRLRQLEAKRNGKK